MDKKVIIATAILVALVAGGVSFYGGIKFADAKKSSSQFGFGNMRGGFASSTANGIRKGQTGMGATSGDIISIDASSLTVKMANGSTKIILFGTSTEVGKFVVGSIGDLAANQSVMVSGTSNADGSLTAKSIQIRPAGEAIPNRGQNNSEQHK